MYLAIVYILLLQITSGLCEPAKCRYSIDISDGVHRGTDIIKNGVTFTQKDYFKAGNSIRGCVCNLKNCVRKCCPVNQSYSTSAKKCVDSMTSGIDDHPTLHNIIDVPEKQICKETKAKIKVEGEFRINNESLIWGSLVFGVDDFCVNKDNDEVTVIVCVESRADWKYVSHSVGMIISMPFLLLTFLVYLIIPEKNLHRKALMFYVICLLLAYVFLVTSNLSKTSFPDVPCHLIGYFIMFFFLGSFLWMNVMCIDMWLTFSGARGYGGTRSTEQKRFLFYCLYAMGAPVMFILFVFLLNTYGDEESIFHPKLGRNKCFLEDGYPQLFYLYLPMAILIGMNIILFILTAIKIQKVKMETAMLKHNDSRKHNYEGDKQQFNLYLKLLFAMGVNWTTEVISWAALWKMQSVPSWIWYLTDLINALYGIFIFFIFVFKKKIWQSLKKRYYVFIGKPHLAQTMVTSTNTRTSHMSSSEVGEYRMSDMRNGRAEERALRP